MTRKTPKLAAKAQVDRSFRYSLRRPPSLPLLPQSDKRDNDHHIVGTKQKRTESISTPTSATYKRRRKSVAFVDLVKLKRGSSTMPPSIPLADSLHIPNTICEQLDIEVAIEKFYSERLLEELNSVRERGEASTCRAAKNMNTLVIIPETPPRNASPDSDVPTPRSLFGTPLACHQDTSTSRLSTPSRIVFIPTSSSLNPNAFEPRADTPTRSVSSPRDTPLHADGRSSQRRLSTPSFVSPTEQCSALKAIEVCSSSPSRMEVDELEYLFTTFPGHASVAESISQFSDRTLCGWLEESTSDPQGTSMDIVEQTPDPNSLSGSEATLSHPVRHHLEKPLSQPVMIDPILGGPRYASTPHSRHQETSIEPTLSNYELDISNVCTRPVPPPHFYDDFDIKAGNLILATHHNVRFQVWRSELAVYSPLFHYLHRNYWLNLRNNKFDYVSLGLDPSGVESILHLIRNEKEGIVENLTLEPEALFHLIHANKFLLFRCVDRLLDNHFATEFPFGGRFPAVLATQMLWLGRAYGYEELVYASIYSLLQEEAFGTAAFSHFCETTTTIAGYSTTYMALTREEILAFGEIKDWMRWLWITETTVPVFNNAATAFPCHFPRGQHAPKCDDEWTRHIKAIHCRSMPEIKSSTHTPVYRQYWTDVYTGFSTLATATAWKGVGYCEGCIDRKYRYFRECRDDFITVFREKVAEFGLLSHRQSSKLEA